MINDFEVVPIGTKKLMEEILELWNDDDYEMTPALYEALTRLEELWKTIK